MRPIEPMKPMAPMHGADPWWPSEMGEPSSSGGQNDLRYAFFPDKHRLLIDHHGTRTTYDSGEHEISGVSQQSGGSRKAFTSQNGTVKLDDLKIVD